MQSIPDTLTNERVVVFIDYHNTLHALRRVGQQIDLVALRDYLAEGRHLIETFLYIATHPLPERQMADRETLNHLQRHGFLIRSKMGQLLPNGRLKCDFDLEMALDVQEFTSRVHTHIVVLVTGDGDFTPLVERLRRQGIRVEVASVSGSIAASLRAMANGFVDLTRIGQEVENLLMPIAPPQNDETDDMDEAMAYDDLLPEPDAAVPLPA
ncbi:MAG: NYN domain-containing protein [Anaerolineae bacterium]|nr:NYN domain-containing protein [Anaerolineae bacterium]